MKQLTIFFIFLIVHFSSLSNSQASEFPDVISTLPNEILTKIVGHVESQDLNSYPTVLSRENLSKVSQKFLVLVRKNDDQFYYLNIIEKIDRLENEAVKFMIVFGTLIDSLNQIEKNEGICQFITRFQPSNKNFLAHFMDDLPVIEPIVQRMKQIFQDRSLYFPAVDSEYNEILKLIFPKKLDVQQIRTLALLQEEVQKFPKEINKIMENAQHFIITYTQDAENFYVNLWCARYKHLRSDIAHKCRYYKLLQQKISAKLEREQLEGGGRRADLVQRGNTINEQYAYLAAYSDSWSTIEHEIHDLKNFADVMEFHDKADKILPKIDEFVKVAT